MMSSINPDETIDDLDSYKIIQKKNGYRFSADSVLLADFILPLKSTDSVIDLGTGSGVIPLILAQKSSVQKIVGIEIQEGLADIAKRNVELNNLSSRIRITQGDLRDIIHNNLFKENSFSVVISNPPYGKPGSERISPCSEKAKAKVELTCDLAEIVKISRYLAAEKARIIYIYSVSRLRDMFSVMAENKLEIHRFEFVQPELGCRAKRFLIEIRA
ncbi:MAG: tRNA (adenine(22)-N(1))-methyltransferase TrmK [Deltaproteobacteria bacterium]|nr:tRNA (adenine(22)-N(1))-methyltransferase TrmK [Deltaproteobacteria bacterium]